MKETVLSREELEQRCRRRLQTAAALGLVLILLDLGLSFLHQDLRIQRDGGTLYMTRPAPGEDPGHISLTATVAGEDGSYERRFDVRLDPQQSREEAASAHREEAVVTSQEDLIRSEIQGIVSAFNEDLSLSRVPLPTSLSGGEAIRWRQNRSSNTPLLILLSLLSMILIYRSRFLPLQRLERSRQRSVRRHLPDFIGELVLLMNAGLVLSRAFELTAEGAMASQDPSDKEAEEDYFQENIHRIYQTVKHMNASFHQELYDFARSSGVSEFTRLCRIISDNIHKGAELNEKLERESESLWSARKRQAEKRGRQAETKMTLPLAIFLCVLIIITVAPALLQI